MNAWGIVNLMLFSFATSNGLLRLVADLINFDTFAFRCRKAQSLQQHGLDVIGRTINEINDTWEQSTAVGITGKSEIDGTPSRVLCPPRDQKVKAGDYIVFVSEVSMPKVRRSDRRSEVDEETAALSRRSEEKLSSSQPPPSTTLPSRALGQARAPSIKAIGNATVAATSMSFSAAKQQNILICGWRRAWSKAGRPDVGAPLFNSVIDSIGMQVAPGSRIVFINRLDPAACDKFMTEAGLAAEDGSEPKRWRKIGPCVNVLVEHVHGDACTRADLEPVIKSRNFNTCIVLGTTANVRMPRPSRDTRVLSILLLLRDITDAVSADPSRPPMHIVAENEEDMTSILALAPRSGSKTPSLDFVNTQGIIARALSQALAYPHMQAALLELFDSSEDSGNLVLRNADRYLPMDAEEISFDAVRRHVASQTNGEELCLGYMDADGCYELVPASRAKRQYVPGDRLALISLRGARGD